MKGNLTIIVRDNDKNEDLVKFNVEAVNYRLTNADSVRIVAYLSDADTDDEVTQEITDCSFGHSLVTAFNLTTEVTFCQKCGLEIKTDEV